MTRHPDQLDELILVYKFPLELLPDPQFTTTQERRASVHDQSAALQRVAAEMRDAQNAMVREWLRHHLLLGSSAMIAARQPVTAVPTELFLAMYHAAKPQAPTAAGDVLTTALNWLAATIRSQRSPRSNLRRWQAVLAPRRSERPWHWDEPQPIRLSPRTATLEIVGGRIHLVLRAVKGRPPVRFQLKGECATDRTLRPDGPGANGRKFNDRLAALRRAMSVRGGLLTHSRGGWALAFADRKAAPILPVRDDLETMFVRSSSEAGWRVRWRGRSAFLVAGEQLAGLANARREQIARRSELRARKIDARTAEAQGVKRRWEHYCRTLYQQTADQLCEWCERHGIERIAVMAGEEWCALAAAGNDDLDQREPTRFPFAGFATQLAQNAARRGIIVVNRPNLRSVKRRKERWRQKLQAEQVRGAAK